jgi:hypothetical protein
MTEPKPTIPPDVMAEIIRGLEMPPAGIRQWMAHERAFCLAHGGARVYPELLALFDACEAALTKQQEG